jgi:tRNA (mo5U34)-methyltransferase
MAAELADIDLSATQARIDSVLWYHEFDFGRGLRTRTHTPALSAHRPIWRFIEEQLDTVDFRGKSVLDIGAWDGFWSFYAERKGAKSVLATDDRTQNWSGGEGILLAKELYGSGVRVDQGVSVYQLASLKQRFDIILFLGVYYHLLDPFYAFAQIRQCCHSNTLLVVDGPEALALPPGAALYDFSNHACELLPTGETLDEILRTTYFSILSRANPSPSQSPSRRQSRLGWRWRLRMCSQALIGSCPGIRAALRQVAHVNRRILLKCAPFEGVNDIHAYRPPFGLHRFDSRFRDSVEG